MEQATFAPQRSKTITGIALLVFMFILPTLIHFCGFKFALSSQKNIVFHELYIWLIFGLILLYTTLVEKQRLLLLGDKSYPLWYTMKSGFKLMMILILVGWVVYLILKPLGLYNHSDRITQLCAIINGNKLLILFMAFTAGVTEELIVRGYLLSRLEIFFKKHGAIIISSVFFAVLHLGYGTIAQVLFPLSMGLIFALHYYKYRNIKLLIFCHFLWDLNSLFIKIHH